MRQQHKAQVIIWVAIALPVLFLPLIGLAIDSGQLFDARRLLLNLADGAARAGAMEIDDSALHGPGAPIVLDVGNAQGAVRDYLATADPAGAATLDPPDVTSTRVTVTLRRTVRTAFLRVVGIQTFEISATAQAQPCSGVDRGVCT